MIDGPTNEGNPIPQESRAGAYAHLQELLTPLPDRYQKKEIDMPSLLETYTYGFQHFIKSVSSISSSETPEQKKQADADFQDFLKQVGNDLLWLYNGLSPMRLNNKSFESSSNVYKLALIEDARRGRDFIVQTSFKDCLPDFLKALTLHEERRAMVRSTMRGPEATVEAIGVAQVMLLENDIRYGAYGIGTFISPDNKEPVRHEVVRDIGILRADTRMFDVKIPLVSFNP